MGTGGEKRRLSAMELKRLQRVERSKRTRPESVAGHAPTAGLTPGRDDVPKPHGPDATDPRAPYPTFSLKGTVSGVGKEPIRRSASSPASINYHDSDWRADDEEPNAGMPRYAYPEDSCEIETELRGAFPAPPGSMPHSSGPPLAASIGTSTETTEEVRKLVWEKEEGAEKERGKGSRAGGDMLGCYDQEKWEGGDEEEGEEGRGVHGEKTSLFEMVMSGSKGSQHARGGKVDAATTSSLSTMRGGGVGSRAIWHPRGSESSGGSDGEGMSGNKKSGVRRKGRALGGTGAGAVGAVGGGGGGWGGGRGGGGGRGVKGMGMDKMLLNLEKLSAFCVDETRMAYPEGVKEGLRRSSTAPARSTPPPQKGEIFGDETRGSNSTTAATAPATRDAIPRPLPPESSSNQAWERGASSPIPRFDACLRSLVRFEMSPGQPVPPGISAMHASLEWRALRNFTA
ncbi:unnamed protein product, partial [Discosporangium mesarthrocarpum]